MLYYDGRGCEDSDNGGDGNVAPAAGIDDERRRTNLTNSIRKRVTRGARKKNNSNKF